MAWAGSDRPRAVARWNDEAGLPQGTVTSITRSEDGYLWVGSFGGLHRFSGERFTEAIAEPDVYAALARVTAVQARGNLIWVGLESGGVRTYFDGTYTDPDQPERVRQSIVWDIRPDHSGRSLLVITSKGVWRLSSNDEWSLLSEKGAMTAVEEESGQLWIGHHAGLLQVHSPTSATNVHPAPVYGLSLDPDGDVWAASLHGPLLVDTPERILPVLGWEGQMPIGAAPVFDAEGDLWFPRLDGMVDIGSWRACKDQVLREEPLVSSGLVGTGPPRSALVDEDGLLWVGTVAQGLTRITTSPFRLLPHPTDRVNFSFGPVARATGLVWHSVNCDQLYGYDGEAWVGHTTVPATSQQYARSRCVRTLGGTPDQLLVGGEGFVTATDGESWTPLSFEGSSLEPTESPTVLQVDSTGVVWMGTSAGNLFRAASAETPFRKIATPDATPPILSILTSIPNQLHLGTTDGLYSQLDGRWTTTTCSDGFACGVIRHLEADPAGVVWAASYGGGLGWWTAGAHGRLERKQHGLPDAFLSSVAFSPDGSQMWLHGNRGLHVLDMLELEEVRAGGLQRLHAHRIPLGEANGWARSSQLYEPPGDLWLVTVTGLVHFDPRAMVRPSTAGSVDIIAVQAGATTVRPDAGLVELPIETGRDITVRFSMPVLGPDQLSRFRYRLRGESESPLESQFSIPSARTEVSYANLAPGTHLFEVQPVGVEGNIGAPASVRIHIEPEWYEHPLLATASTLAVVLTLGLLALVRVRAAEARNLSLRREVEAQQVAEQRIEEQREYYRQIFNSAGNAFFLFDSSARCVDVNREARNLFDADAPALIGRSPSELGLDGSAAITTSGGPARCRRPNGSTFPARVVTATFSIGDQRHFLVSVLDLSELIEARATREHMREQLEVARRIESFGRLAAGVAHDMNNVITAILGYASLIADSARDDPATVEESAQEILESAQRGSRLVRRMLTFGHTANEQPEPIDLHRTLNELARLLRQLLPEDVELVIRGDDVPMLEISPTGIEQVILNLVVNASDAMPHGGRIEAEVQTDGADVLLSVTDQGVGIPEELRERVFEPFFTTKDSGRGTGLGLATVKDIVVQAGGSLTIDSAAGQGTTVQIRFPTSTAAPSSRQDERRTASGPAVRGSGRRLMVVDDNQHVLRALKMPLERAGFEVVAFSRPERALAWFKSEDGSVDGIVTDVVMPALNGRQLIDAIQRSHPQVPVLFVSGYTEEVVLRRGVDGNVENLLVKPFSSSELLRRVAAMIGGPASSS